MKQNENDEHRKSIDEVRHSNVCTPQSKIYTAINTGCLKKIASFDG